VHDANLDMQGGEAFEDTSDEDDIEGGPLVKAKHFEEAIIRMTISTISSVPFLVL
jgi:hypothetical protein